MIRQKTFKNDVEAYRYIDRQLYNDGRLKMDTIVEMTDTEFHDACDDIIAVYVGDDWTFVVVDNPDFDEILIFKMSTVEYYAKWELFIRKDLYYQRDHTNKWVWFNIGQNGDHFVQWQDAVINASFDPESIRFEGWEDLGTEFPKTVWVKKDDDRLIMPKSVEYCFDDLEKVAELVEKSFWAEENVNFDGTNSVHIRAIFDMDDVNEYGVGKTIWESH